MSQPPSPPVMLLFLGVVFILLILCSIIAWTIRIGLRVNKGDPPKLKFLFTVAFLQTLLGGTTIFGMRAVRNDPLLDLGIGLGIILLSGLPFIKTFFSLEWKPSLGIWGVAAAMQLLLLPICSMVLLFLLMGLMYLLFPPVY